MKADITKIPFSVYGSYFKVEMQNDCFYISTVHGNFEDQRIFELILPECSYSVQPWLLTFMSGNSRLNICMKGSDELLIYGNMQDVELKHCGAGLFAFMQALSSKHIHLVESRYGYFVDLCAEVGSLNLNSKWKVEPVKKSLICSSASAYPVSDKGCYTILLSFSFYEKIQDNSSKSSPEKITHEIKTHFEKWQNSFDYISGKYANSYEQAVYLLWMSTVYPQGNYSYPAVLMSKNHMNSVWSWDNCFNALALCKHHPKLAFEQLQLIFDKQLPDGKLPDRVNDLVLRSIYTKPPIHGWCIMRMIEKGFVFSKDQMTYLCKKLSSVTQWWLTARDDNCNGICQYNHGNESGWDNCTCFDNGVPVETPELTAYLLLQMKAIAKLYKLLGENGLCDEWKQRFVYLRNSFLSLCFINNKPVCFFDGKPINNNSLLPYMIVYWEMNCRMKLQKNLFESCAVTILIKWA
jgi:putative isomerase